jgi:hypothetical protein
LKPLGYRVSITGVFCHASPQVRFTDSGGTTRTCELADLLVVIDDKSSSSPDRRAGLVQAKLCSTTGAISTSGTAAHQLDLYRNWPTFVFTSSAYPATARTFSSSPLGMVGDSGRYGGIDLVASPREWKQIPAAPSMTMGAGLDLSDYLAGAATGSDGRAALIGRGDDWSDTVEDLLTVTMTQTFTHRASIGASPRPRQTTAIAFATDGLEPRTEFHFLDSAPPRRPDEPSPEGPEDVGISTLHIRIDRTEG